MPADVRITVPDLGELFGDFGVGDEPRCVRTHECARQEIADYRRKTCSPCEVPQDQRGGEPSGKRED